MMRIPALIDTPLPSLKELAETYGMSMAEARWAENLVLSRYARNGARGSGRAGRKRAFRVKGAKDAKGKATRK
jgi:hypothetical protein